MQDISAQAQAHAAGQECVSYLIASYAIEVRTWHPRPDAVRALVTSSNYWKAHQGFDWQQGLERLGLTPCSDDTPLLDSEVVIHVFQDCRPQTRVPTSRLEMAWTLEQAAKEQHMVFIGSFAINHIDMLMSSGFQT